MADDVNCDEIDDGLSDNDGGEPTRNRQRMSLQRDVRN
jgi:hypothetical protein